MLNNDAIFAGVFQDAANMVFWCEDYGKQKALAHGKRKRVSRAVDELTGVMPRGKDAAVLSLVSPSLMSSSSEFGSEAMAILDPLRQESSWLSLIEKFRPQ